MTPPAPRRNGVENTSGTSSDQPHLHPQRNSCSHPPRTPPVDEKPARSGKNLAKSPARALPCGSEARRVLEREAIGHARHEVGDLVGAVAARGEVVEDPLDDSAGARMLRLCVRREVDVLEHERAEGEHRAADLLALRYVAFPLRRLDEVLDERVDPPRAGL